MKALVVGGGIGGLTAAIALRRAGHDVTVAERSPAFAPAGAGIILAPNATAVLAALGVDLTERGLPLPALDLLSADGRLLRHTNPRETPSDLGPSLALTRTELHAALREALPEGVRVVHGVTVDSVREGERGTVAVRIADAGAPGADAAPAAPAAGSPAVAGLGPDAYDVVVGADGVRSAVRAACVGQQRLRYSGVTCWRGLTGNRAGLGRAFESWGPGTRIGAVPLRDDRLYYFLVRKAPRRAPDLTWPGGFRRAFAGHGGEPGRLLDALTEAPPLHHDLEELDRPVWGRGRVLLLGDAAHAMTPNLGQGAAMAIEDAYALARALAPGAEGALARYAALRHRRVRAVQLTSRRLGRVAHWRGPVGRLLRETGLRALPDELTERQFAALVDPARELLRG
ncbi:FAD-dependent monooxygenase [Streptomyces sp. MUM 203J]|uniref:FAD-dependent monooxygenase n=1 Tax=Streptomyces sp. MUM 203J TaxID=2791990 RepID=UPI001F035F23|nr:FAD-dependent monooxygenase [Streptomyces sp. MUM 203J]MCH0540837.1 FAD-dependent monooxygenase [Streptomyces sp. MUM 203J]